MTDKRIPASRIRDVWLDGSLTVQAAAEAVRLARSNLWMRARALGLPPRKGGRQFAIPDAAEFSRRYLSGTPVAELAVLYGVSAPSICYRARTLGLPKRPHAQPKVDFDRDMACRMWLAGVTAAQIGVRLGVGPHAVAYAARRAGCPARLRGFKSGMTLEQWDQAELGRHMAAAAAADAMARKRREMARERADMAERRRAAA